MITMSELLNDPIYRRYFVTEPKLPEVRRSSPPWRFYVQQQLDGPWRRKDCWTYQKAFEMVKKFRIAGAHDMAIMSKGVAFKCPSKRVRVTRGGMPVMFVDHNGVQQQKTKEIFWQPKLPEGEPDHLWCPYCRRPTVFRTFLRHHAFAGLNLVDLTRDDRCTICGSSATLVRGH